MTFCLLELESPQLMLTQNECDATYLCQQHPTTLYRKHYGSKWRQNQLYSKGA